jgi:hypothetical protein
MLGHSFSRRSVDLGVGVDGAKCDNFDERSGVVSREVGVAESQWVLSRSAWSERVPMLSFCCRGNSFTVCESDLTHAFGTITSAVHGCQRDNWHFVTGDQPNMKR